MKKLIVLTVILTAFIGYSAEYRSAVYSSGGAVATSDSTTTFTNKTIDADGTGNSITNIENENIKAAAAIAVNKLAAITASRALVADASGFLAASTVTTTELQYLAGIGAAPITATYAGATKAQTVEAEHTAPVIRIDNTTEEDGEGGRAGSIIFSGERSGGETVDSVKIIGSHDGDQDDDKGKLQFQTNSGSGLATAVTINSSGYMGVGTTSPSVPVTVSGTIDSTFLRLGSDSYLGVGKWIGLGFGYLSTAMKTAIIVECTDATYARGTLHFCNNNEANTNNVSLSDSKAYITAAGDAWFSGDVSALTFTDRTPYPETTQQAYDAIATMERLPEGEYKAGNKDKQLKHSKLHSFVKADKVVKDKEGNDVVINGRDLSATVSCLVEIIKDQKARIEALEKKIKDK